MPWGEKNVSKSCAHPTGASKFVMLIDPSFCRILGELWGREGDIIESCSIAPMASTRETKKHAGTSQRKKRDVICTRGRPETPCKSQSTRERHGLRNFLPEKITKERKRNPNVKKDNKSKNKKMIELRGRLHGHLEDETNEDSRKNEEGKSSPWRRFQVMMPAFSHSIMRSQSNGEETRRACALSSFMRQEQWGQQERPQHC